MIIIAGFVLGAVYGVRKARKAGGKRLDLLQYGAGFGIAFSLLGLFATLLLDRLVL
ncbi:hypothetical protein [Tabrizicola sp. TH137]|uniref:hypothetical protein n=1 Tax=Tabrizicola sp. TH137 TaxID=2067452 RepID=UPI00157081F8|nr:hypothetical protein [Tabrizicola sp. TH137]